MHKDEYQKEKKLAQWLIDQYIAWRMGTLEEWKVEHLDKTIPDWKHIASRQIVAAQIGRVVHSNFRNAIEQNISAPWDIVVQTVQNELKNDCEKYGHGAVEK